MSDNAFTNAMNQIAAEADAEQIRDAKFLRRQQIISRIRCGVGFLFLTALLAAGFVYRVELQQFASDKLRATKPQISGETGAKLQGLQDQAAKRDKALEELTK